MHKRRMLDAVIKQRHAIALDLGNEVSMGQHDSNRILLVSGMFEPFSRALESSEVAARFTPVYLGGIEYADITRGYVYIDNDVCVSIVAIIGQYLRALQDADHLPEAVLAAELCRECRSINLVNLMRLTLDHAGFDSVEIVQLTDAELHMACEAPVAADSLPDYGKTRIGLFGPTPVLLTPTFTNAVTERLQHNGLEVVLPPLAHLIGQRDVFEPAIDYFIDAGLSYAIGVIPFGCMSGHAYARGRLRTLQKKHPNMQITLIDYDPSASDINTINRTELVIQSILDY